MAQEHPFGKCGKVQKSPFSRWSFSPLLLVCTKAIHITAVSLLFLLLLPASKPFQLKKRKENSYLLVYWGCVLPIYHVCIYLWVKIVSLVLFGAGGECFKNMVWDICFFLLFFFSFPSLKTKKKKPLESALIISHCTEYSALSLMVSPAVVWVLLGFFVCFYSLSTSTIWDDFKSSRFKEEKEALSKVSTVNAVICKELLGRSLSVSMEGGVQHFHWCFCAIVTGWEQDLS